MKKLTLAALAASTLTLVAFSGHADNDTVVIQQVGDYNTGLTNQIGNNNQAWIYQNNYKEFSQITQNGIGNQFVSQEGANQSTTREYSTANGIVYGSQNGDDNLALVTNVGNTNQDVVTQDGTGNYAQVSQADNWSGVNINQQGTSNYARAVQTGR